MSDELAYEPSGFPITGVFGLPFSASGEVWREIPNWRLSFASTFGRVATYMSRGYGQPEKWHVKIPNWLGLPEPYLSIQLCAKGKNKYYRLHNVVLFAFVGPRPAENFVGCHNDGNRENNRLYNLRWDTQVGNMADKEQHGTKLFGEKHPQSILSEAQVIHIRRRFREIVGDEVADAFIRGEKKAPYGIWMRMGRELGVNFHTIRAIVMERNWKHLV